MLPHKSQKIRHEEIPLPEVSSFTLREFRWPRFPFNWHFHPELELTLIKKGCGQRFVGDSIEEFEPGDLCLLGADTPHCWASHAGARGEGHSQVIQFLPDFLGEGFLRAPEMRPIAELLQQARRGLALDGRLRQSVAKKMGAITAFSEGSPQRLNVLLSILGEMAESLSACRPLASVDYAPPANERAGRKLAGVLDYIHCNLGSQLSQKQVAGTIRASPQAFSRFFKQGMGKSYVAYVNELKISKACRALIESDATITEIAFASGFNNLSNFNEQFRHLKMMTPRDYRQKALASAR